MMNRISLLTGLAGGVLLLAVGAPASAAPMVMPARPFVMPAVPGGFHPITPIHPGVMPGSDPRTWSPYPLNPVMPGSDPRTWSPYPLNPRPVMPGSDPRTWSPYPLNPRPVYQPYYDNGPIPYWLQNPAWRKAMPSPSPSPYVSPYLNPYLNPTANLYQFPLNFNYLDPYGLGL